MTNEKLEQANNISKRIRDLEKIIGQAKKHPCEWIQSTFGNGSNKVTISDDESINKKIIELAIRENEYRLEQLKTEFSNL